MHELSIAHSILSIAERSVPPGTKGTVSAVNLQIGELSSIEIDALRFAFEAIKSKTVVQNAELNIEVIPGEAKCSDCDTFFHMDSYGSCCPKCGCFLVSILKGKELKVLSITVDE